MKKFVRKLKSIPFLYRVLVTLKRSYLRAVGLRHAIQSTNTDKGYQLITLGSKHCGWTIVDEPSLQNGIILSAGLGEDGSFDVELAAKYNATIHIIDPTPRAIAHFEAIVDRLGQPSRQAYSELGKQPAEAYDLRSVRKDQLHLHKVALWNEETRVKFFLPKNKKHVSHSIINFQHNYSNTTPYIEVGAVPLTVLMKGIGVDAIDVALLKLDIEGAEIEVLEQIVSVGFKPKQLLVEFDELNRPSKRGIMRVDKAYRLLRSCGYNLIHTDQQANFLFIRDDAPAA